MEKGKILELGTCDDIWDCDKDNEWYSYEDCIADNHQGTLEYGCFGEWNCSGTICTRGCVYNSHGYGC